MTKDQHRPCKECGIPMLPQKHPLREGFRRVGGHGLCSRCYMTVYYPVKKKDTGAVYRPNPEEQHKYNVRGLEAFLAARRARLTKKNGPVNR
ncbi:hypothetical protein [Zhihengliuella flava]|uniref:Uncharacterized protein n=1 Tax=Zhihengliuella flava TaxID=1285193 RepID=A0A931GK82_9MICC|nr:hypothetical protein [Zhihengliuella flava]MBG6083269.1 hypothetical protein [Zhihengliuella flava]